MFLDVSTLGLDLLIEQTKQQLGGLDVLFIDPRRQSMGGDENQSQTMTAWCTNVDQLRTKHNLAIIIVHHKGKSTRGAGRDSSVFDAWLDTMIWLEPTKKLSASNISISTSKQSTSNTPVSQPNLQQVKLSIQSRDTDQAELSVCFNYPTWEISQQQYTEDTSKAAQAVQFISSKLQTANTNQIGEMELRLAAMQAGISEYASKTALDRLEQSNMLQRLPDKAKGGNWKTVHLVPPP